MENNDEDKNIEILIEIININEQLVSTFNYLMPHIKDISSRSVNSTLSQEIKSEIQSLKFIMDDRFTTFQNFKRSFENNLMNLCEHDWMTDYIDKSEYESRRITYCEKCKLTKRQ
jgi:hypothetical protein